jgi:hypothetical protein
MKTPIDVVSPDSHALSLATIKRTLAFPRMWVLTLISVVTTLVLYGRSLTLPLYMDDVIYGRYASGISLPELFYRLDIVPYYRPMSLLPWKVLELVTGSYNVPMMHGFNLIVYILNGLLLGWLVQSVTRQSRFSIVTMMLYLTFPFSYQTVPWAAALGHLMAGTGTLLALIGLRFAQQGRGVLSQGLLFGGTLLAVFSHENGIVVPLIVALLWIVIRQTGQLVSPLRMARWLLPALGMALIYVIIWLNLPKDGGGVGLNWGDVALNALYFTQGLTFPFAWVFRPLGDHVGAIVPALIFAALIGVVLRVSLWRREILLGLLWYSVGVIVPILFLTHAYVIDGPRLMTFGSAGAALVWSGVIGTLWEGGRQRHWLAHAAALLLILGSSIFVAQRMQLHDRLAAVYERVWQDGRAQQDRVYINLPAWVAYQERTFPMGSEGITYLTDYIGFPDLVLVNTAYWGSSLAVARDDIRPEFSGYWLGNASPVIGVEESAQLVEGRGGGVLLTNVAGSWAWESFERAAVVPSSMPYTFANGIQLWAESRLPTLSLTWRVPSSSIPSADLSVFAHLLCADTLVAQADGIPLRSAFPFQRWAAEATWSEVRYFSAANVDPAACQIALGLYDPVTNQRITLADGTGDAVIVFPANE